MRTFTITELIAATGVPPATIHHYLRAGLLPKPKRLAPNRFGYDERHVRRLKLIRMLRDRRTLSLPMIKRILPELLQLEATEAFLPEMWDRALAPRLSGGRRSPSARLLEAAKDAFSPRGYDAVNVDEICRSAKMAKGSFYRHYRSKEDLFFAAADSAATEVVSAFRDTVEPDEKLSTEQAGEVLARLLEPRLPMFLDLFARALQRRPGYAAAARKTFSDAAAEIGLRITGGSPAQELGARAVGAAVLVAFRRVQDVASALPS
jgi:AcrR family transcriptional regulator/predicted DNA-binding transcriptional regulator AlpA